jgi:hypothetical protein
MGWIILPDRSMVFALQLLVSGLAMTSLAIIGCERIGLLAISDCSHLVHVDIG